MTIRAILAFILGVLVFFGGHADFAWWLVLFFILMLFLASRVRPHSLFFLLLFLFSLGYAWADFRVSRDLSHRLPLTLEEKPLRVSGVVTGLPVVDAFGTHFTLSGVMLTLKTGQVHAGESLQCHASLIRVHGVQNPGGVDEEAIALANHISAKGVASDCMLLKPSVFSPERWMQSTRAWMTTRLTPLLPHTEKSGWLMALMLGERVNINPDDWTVLRNTGTNHLMAIGGLHLGMVALWASFLVGRVWRRHPLHQASVSLVVCFLYAVLAGFSIPTERAFVMLLVFSLSLFLRRKILAWQSLGLALWVMVVWNPAIVLVPGFWLSFAAIAWIVYGLQGRPALKAGHLQSAARLQWFITLGLLPLSLYFFQSVAVQAVLANAIAIPWLGVFILPFCLLAMMTVPLSPWLASKLLMLAGWGLSGLWVILEKLSHWHAFIMTIPQPSLLLILQSLLGMAVLLSPRGMSAKPLGFLCVLPLFLQDPLPIPKAHYRVTVLDVGQGLSIVVRTTSHVMVFDAGARFTPSNDMGGRVVLPYLNSVGVSAIDALVVSHGDNDHAGGAPILLKSLPVGEFITSVPAQFPTFKSQPCHAGESWRWDGVQFVVLAPNSLNLQGNNASCVVMIDNGHVRTLLPGDIEANGETALLASSGVNLQADLLIAPHHGSDTSSTRAFRQAVNPSVVIYSTGYRNHYHLPSASVLLAYTKQNTRQLNTVNEGAMEFEMGDALQLMHRAREAHPVWRS